MSDIQREKMLNQSKRLAVAYGIPNEFLMSVFDASGFTVSMIKYDGKQVVIMGDEKSAREVIKGIGMMADALESKKAE